MRRKFAKMGFVILVLFGVQHPALPGDPDMEWAAKNRGKPSAPVSITVEGEKHHDAGEFVSLLVKVRTRSELDKLTITLRPTSGLSLVGEQVFLVSNPAKGEIIEIPVNLVASGDGRHRLRVLVSTERDGVVRAAATGMPISVGAVLQNRKTAPLVSTPEGEMLREVQVIEEVNPDL